MRGALLLAGLLTAAAVAEGAVRAFCAVRTFSDIRRNHYAWTALAPNRYDAALELEGLKPDYHAALAACGRTIRYDTAPAPNPEWGYRINGAPGDSGPVYGVILGDSFTEGRHVDNSRTFASRLSALSGRRFLNAGRVAARGGPTNHLEYLTASRLLDLKPKVVILQLNPTDIQDELRRASRREAPAHAALLRSSVLAFHVYHAFFAKTFAPKPSQDLAGSHARMKTAIDGLIALGRRHGFKVLVLVDDVAALGPEAEHARKRGVLLDAGIGDQAKHFRFDGHINEAGHEEVAQRIWLRINEPGWPSRTAR